MRCKGIVKNVNDTADFFGTSVISLPKTYIYEDILKFFGIKKTYENEQLTKRILEVVPKYTESVKNALQDIVNVFCTECEVLPYGGEATFMVAIPIEKGNDNKPRIFFAISDVFDTMFLAMPVDDIKLDVNILKSVKLKDHPEVENIFRQKFESMKDHERRGFKIEHIEDMFQGWNEVIIEIKKNLDEWLKYQKKLSNEDLGKIIESRIEELKEVASYLQKLKKEPQAKMKLNCFQFYTLHGLLHELMHYFFHYSLTKKENESYRIEEWVNISANYIIDKLFDIRHLDIWLPVSPNYDVKVIPWGPLPPIFLSNLLRIAIQEFTRSPSFFRNLIERLPEEIAKEIRQKELDILLGNHASIPNFRINTLNKTFTKVETGTITFFSEDTARFPSAIPKIKETIFKVLERFTTPIDTIEDLLVYRDPIGYVYKSKPEIPDLKDFRFIEDEGEFIKEQLETYKMLGSYFTPVILRYLNKEKGFRNRKWKKKSIVKGMLYGTPFKKEYFKSLTGSAFLIIDTSGSMDDLFIQVAIAAVYSTLRHEFSRVDITVVQFESNFVVEYYKNISVEQLFNIKPYRTGGYTFFYKVTNAIATNPRLRMEYNRSDFVVLISDCVFQGKEKDYKYRIPLKPLVLFYPWSKQMFNELMKEQPKTFPYNWIKQAFLIDRETIYNKARSLLSISNFEIDI